MDKGIRNRSSNWTHSQQIRHSIAILLLQLVQPLPGLRQEIREARRQGGRVRELVVDIEPVEPDVLDELHRARDERRAQGRVRDEVEVVCFVEGVRRPADREQDFQVAILELSEVEL